MDYNKFHKNNPEALQNACPRLSTRIINSLHTQNIYKAKEILLSSYRIKEDVPFQANRMQLAHKINVCRGEFKNLLQSLNEILNWSSVNLTIEEETLEIIKNSKILEFAYSRMLPRQLDNPNAFWAIFPFETETGEKLVRIELFNYEQVEQTKSGVKITVENRNGLADGTYTFFQGGIFEGENPEKAKYSFFLNDNSLKHSLYGQLGGDVDNIDLDGNETYYVSPIQGAFDTATILFLLTLDAKLLELGVINVITVLRASPCTTCNGSGYVPSDDGINSTACSSCNGTGFADKGFRLGDVLYMNQNQIMGHKDEKVEKLTETVNNMMAHYHAPLEPLKFAQELIKELKKELQIEFAQVVPKTFQESASSNEQQWLNRHYLCDTIGFQFFQNLEEILQSIQDCFMVSSPDVKIQIPDTFVDENEARIRQRIVQMRKDGSPNADLIKECKRLANKIYKDTPNQLRAEIFRLDNDYLGVYNSHDKTIATQNERDRIYSEQLPVILEKISNPKLNSDFSKWSDEEIKEKVDELFDYTEVPPITDGTEFNTELEQNEL